MQRGSTQTEAARQKIAAGVSATKQRQKAEIDAMRARLSVLESRQPLPEISPEAVAALEAFLAARTV